MTTALTRHVALADYVLGRSRDEKGGSHAVMYRVEKSR
jgi:hypothetical protein